MFDQPSKMSEALSPWGASRHQSVRLSPLKTAVQTQVMIPGSKSFTNRALIMSAIAQGKSTLSAPLFSDDSYWCVEALRGLGVDITVNRDEELIDLLGLGDQPLSAMQTDTPIYLGSAGTVARFLPAVFAAQGSGWVTFSASHQLSQRPLAELTQALKTLGAQIEHLYSDQVFPLRILGGSMVGGDVVMSGKRSSQFISALLIAAPLTRLGVRITIPDLIVQSDYVRMTIEMMQNFGVDVSSNSSLTMFEVKPQKYQASHLQLEADASTATYFFALAASTCSEVVIPNLNPQTLQPDLAFIKCLEMMGCEVFHDHQMIKVRGPQRLIGGQTFNLNAYSDSVPALAAIAPFADAPIHICGVEHIRGHECDRLAVLAHSLHCAGVDVIEYADGLLITPPSQSLKKFTVNPHDDHRMAMALSITALSGSGGVIEDPACVSKTCPDFYQRLKSFGCEPIFT